jgi:hypothetical protein
MFGWLLGKVELPPEPMWRTETHPDHCVWEQQAKAWMAESDKWRRTAEGWQRFAETCGEYRESERRPVPPPLNPDLIGDLRRGPRK